MSVFLKFSVSISIMFNYCHINKRLFANRKVRVELATLRILSTNRWRIIFNIGQNHFNLFFCYIGNSNTLSSYLARFIRSALSQTTGRTNSTPSNRVPILPLECGTLKTIKSASVLINFLYLLPSTFLPCMKITHLAFLLKLQ